jgi:hypothetical protein
VGCHLLNHGSFYLAAQSVHFPDMDDLRLFGRCQQKHRRWNGHSAFEILYNLVAKFVFAGVKDVSTESI